MSNTITYSFCDNFIDRLADHIEGNYIRTGKDLSRLGIVFGGRRPSLFLKRELARRLNKDYLSPRFLTVDEFMKDILFEQKPFRASEDLDQCYLLYSLAQKVCPQILHGRETFAAFLPWTREIARFIDLLDLEMVEDKALLNIQQNARIGYPVPKDINQMLEQVVQLRSAYHAHMKKNGQYSRGYRYLRAAQTIEQSRLEGLDDILFCNFFYFHKSEEEIVLKLVEKKKATLIFQGDERKWPVLNRISRRFNCKIIEGDIPDPTQFDLKLYSCFDVHSQVCQIREILKTIKNPQRAVIVLPQTAHLIPLLSEITSVVEEFNVSMGYPLKRSSLYSLFELIFKAQLSRTEKGYYTRDFLKVLRHPLVKSLKLGGSPAATRVLVHKIEEVLTGLEATDLSGAVFVDLDKIVQSDEVFDLAGRTLKAMDIEDKGIELKSLLSKIHQQLFREWEGIKNFSSLAQRLKEFLKMIVEQSRCDQYPLNLNIIERMLTIADELEGASFRQEPFLPEEIFRIFTSKLDRELVAFHGSPLKGLQVLGLFETRSLNFDQVIVMDVNEGVLPHLNIYEPLIPREVMLSLNLDRLEQEEEIQRYQFMRLISSAKNVHCVYQETEDKEKSRFVEELIWEEQKRQKKLEVVDPARPSFAVKVRPQHREVAKTPEMIEFLKGHHYSASSLNMYLRDPMEFYTKYVLGLREKDDLLEEPENRQVGTFVHDFLEVTFKKFIGRKPVIDAAFRKHFQRILDERFADAFGKSMRPDMFLLKSVLDVRMNRFLEKEAQDPVRDIDELVFVEKLFRDKIALSCGEINFVYKIDRVDRLKDGSILLLDYKTGAVDQMPMGLEMIENMALERENILEHVRSFQLPLYFFYLDKYFAGQPVRAAFYNLRTLKIRRFPDSKTEGQSERVKSAFLRALDHVLSEILDPMVPFSQPD